MLDAFRDGQIHILLGTQMIAKGLDFPNVTLVGVVNADVGLHLPDFRAAERTFQLLAQVAGRTGRGDKGGQVLVQTFTPEHPCIALGGEARLRRRSRSRNWRTARSTSYPPYQRLARLIVRSEKEEARRSSPTRWPAAFQRRRSTRLDVRTPCACSARRSARCSG